MTVTSGHCSVLVGAKIRAYRRRPSTNREDGGVSFPKDYLASDKTLILKPSSQNVTDLDYDTGNGRSGFSAFNWSR
jgi:hypothetical protein